MPVVRALNALVRWRLAVPIALGTGLIFLIVAWFGVMQTMREMRALAHSIERRATLRTITVKALEAESAQRGYLLVRERPYRTPASEAIAQLRRESVKARQLYANVDHISDAEVAQMQALVDRKIAEMEQTLALADASYWDQALQVVRSGKGFESMLRMSAKLDELLATERGFSEALDTNLQRTLLFYSLALTALVAFAVMAVYFLSRQAQRQRETEVQNLLALQAERDKLELAVRQQTSALSELARHLQSSREDERHLLARELHDELGGLLTAAKLDLARIKGRVKDSGPEVMERVAHLGRTLDSVIALKRRIIEDLRPSTLSNLGLKVALDVLCQDYAKRSDARVNYSIEDVPLSKDDQLTAYRLVQEALTNAAKYANAATIDVSLARDADGRHAIVTVRDDGDGFNPSVTPTRNTHGLAGMHFRVQSSGGELSIHSRPGEGTQLVARLPLRRDEPTPAA